MIEPQNNDKTIIMTFEHHNIQLDEYLSARDICFLVDSRFNNKNMDANEIIDAECFILIFFREPLFVNFIYKAIQFNCIRE